MPPNSPKKLLKNSLESLAMENCEKFISELLDRRDGVRMNQVEGKSFLKVADVMISVYTERGALEGCQNNPTFRLFYLHILTCFTVFSARNLISIHRGSYLTLTSEPR
ncbi:hypothetical protein XENOCAPTIV_026220 [Xenoophorus captivus]|uniref:Pyrin domain-containing protein n=1 Tax=Xenoophorus captivus TaxID=1517983 RepID=A0ABV0RJH4_9TELE